MEGLPRVKPTQMEQLLYKALKPGALSNMADSAKTALQNPQETIGGLLGYLGTRDYLNPYLNTYGLNLNLQNQTLDYDLNDKYKFSLGQKGGYPEVGMQIKF